MQIRVQEEKYVEVALLIQIIGDIEATEAQELAKTFEKYIKRGFRRFILDLQEVPYMDSSALGVLIKIFMIIRKMEGELTLRRLSTAVDHLLTMNGLKEIFKIE